MISYRSRHDPEECGAEARPKPPAALLGRPLDGPAQRLRDAAEEVVHLLRQPADSGDQVVRRVREALVEGVWGI